MEIGVVMLLYLRQALDAARAKAGQEGRKLDADDLAGAVREGALLRLRPIEMTDATIIVGLLPIMMGGGTGSEVMRRIAAPMVGGMISATLLTLALIPAVYLIWQRRRIRRTMQ